MLAPHTALPPHSVPTVTLPVNIAKEPKPDFFGPPIATGMSGFSKIGVAPIRLPISKPLTVPPFFFSLICWICA